MRKIVLSLLFLIFSAVFLFKTNPCKAENFPKNSSNEVNQIAPPSYYVIFQYNSPVEYYKNDAGKLEGINKNAKPPATKDLPKPDPSEAPAASKDYGHAGYWN